MRRLVIGWLLLFACVSRAEATTYYVSKSGSDANSCATAQSTTQANQKLTVNAGVACLSAGDTLQIHAGTYAEALVGPSLAGTAWTAGNYFTIKAYPAETVWLKPTAGSANWVLDLQTGQRYIEFDGINLDTTNATVGNDLGGMFIDSAGPSHHIRFKNAEIIGNRLDGNVSTSRVGIVMGGTTGNNEITNVTVHGSGGNNTYYGMYIRSNDNVFDGMNIYDVGVQCVQFYSGSGNQPSRNIFKNSQCHDVITGQLTYRAGILVGGDNNLVYNTLVYNLNTNNAAAAPSVGLVAYSGTGTQFLNNTVVGNHATAILVNPAATSTLIRNNIVYNNTAGTITDNGTGTVSDHNSTSDPTFTNGSGTLSIASDFNLQASSNAIDAGTTATGVTTDYLGTARPQNTAYDIGAYEYITGGPGGGGGGGTGTAPTHVSTTATASATCRVGDVQYKTGTGAGLYACTAVNTWSLLAVAPVSVTNGGTGAAPSGDDQVFVSSSSSAGSWKTLTDCASANQAVSYSTSTNTWGCTSITGGGGGGVGTVTNTGTLTADTFVVGNGSTDIKAATSQVLPGANGGGWVRLDQITTSGSQSTVDFTSISGSYRAIRVVYTSRDTASGTGNSLIYARFNNDTTAGDYTVAGRSGSVNGVALVSNVSASASGGGFIGGHPNDGNTALIAAAGEFMVVDYAGSNHKRTVALNGFDEATNGYISQTSSFRWASGSAITRVTMFSSGTAFKDGMVWTLYGLN